MTAEEAVEFAKHLDEPYSKPFCCPGEIETLRAVYRLAPDSLRRKALKELLDVAEAFRRDDAPGHAVWYGQHLRAAAYAAQAFGVVR
jgi:hypothetical protein